MKHIIEIECPYCGLKNIVGLDVGAWESQILICEQMVGGCDQEFTFKPYNWDINVSAHVGTVPWSAPVEEIEETWEEEI